MKMSRLALTAAGLLVLAACGNKGPLVLPQKPVPVEAQDPLPPPVEPVDAAPAEEVPASSTERVIVPPDYSHTVPPPPKDDGDGTPR